MSLFFIDPAQINDNRVIIGGKDFHHLHHVLKLKKGDYLQVADGEKFLYQARIEHIGLHEAQALILEPLGKMMGNNLNIIVGQALPKGQKMDLIVQKGTELGVSVFVPLLTERVIGKTSASTGTRKIERWGRIALEASKQCKRLTVPKIHAPLDLSEFCQAFHQVSYKIILWEKATQRLKASLSTEEPSPHEVAIATGPEGGFTTQEVTLAEGAGFKPLFLGERILRTETASLVLVSILQFLWGDIG